MSLLESITYTFYTTTFLLVIIDVIEEGNKHSKGHSPQKERTGKV